jgi:hypothetical protein
MRDRYDGERVRSSKHCEAILNSADIVAAIAIDGFAVQRPQICANRVDYQQPDLTKVILFFKSIEVDRTRFFLSSFTSAKLAVTNDSLLARF